MTLSSSSQNQQHPKVWGYDINMREIVSGRVMLEYFYWKGILFMYIEHVGTCSASKSMVAFSM